MNFKPLQFESFCAHPNPEVKCVILFGNNEGEIATLHKKCVTAICGSAEDAFKYALLDMDDVSKEGGEIYAEFHEQSLIGGRRLIAVKNVDNSLTPFLKGMLPETNSQNLLLLISNSLNTKSSLITWAKDREDVVIVGCYEERESDIMQEISRMLKEKGLSADMPTMHFLCSRLSPDRKINQEEIDKLDIYLGDRKVVSVDDVRVAVSEVAGANVEDLCYHTASGDIMKASQMFDRLIKEGNDAAGLIRQIAYHFSRLLDSVAQMEEGSSVDEVIRLIRPPLMFYRKDSFKRQLQLWNKDRLLGALGILYDCERDCKSTNMPADYCASYAILRLAGAAQKLQSRR